MNSPKQTASGFISFAALLGVLFIGLKLTGFIAWSWWWVLAPLWMGTALVLGIVLVLLLGLMLAAWLS